MSGSARPTSRLRRRLRYLGVRRRLGCRDLHDSNAAIGRALELGINLFDTAQGYGFGAAEQLLAQALQGRVHREEVVIATKGGLRMQDGSLLRDTSAGWLRQGVEASLRNLGTDYLDLYQLHWPDPHTPAALAELVAEGKIRHVWGPPPRGRVSPQEHSTVIRTTVNDHAGSAT